MATYSFIVWVSLSGGLLLLFGYAAIANLRRQHQTNVELDDIIPYLVPVNLKSFVEAMDPSQDGYLRHSLSPQDFQKLQRKRMRLAKEYLQRMNRNAELLQQIGYGQLRSQNSLVAEQAQQLIDAGVHVRLYAFVGLGMLFLRRVWGVRSISLAKIVEAQRLMSANLIPAYQSLQSKAEQLTALRNSVFHDALMQNL